MPNITRNAIVNCAEMVTYDIIKEKILEFNLLTGKVLEPRKCPISKGDRNSREDTAQGQVAF